MDKEPNNLGDIFDKHIEFEFDKQDVDATMTTMTEDPYVRTFCRKNAKRFEDY
jgi:hypothetical protein